jgi:hypothetical protein
MDTTTLAKKLWWKITNATDCWRVDCMECWAPFYLMTPKGTEPDWTNENNCLCWRHRR